MANNYLNDTPSNTSIPNPTCSKDVQIFFVPYFIPFNKC